MEAAIILLGLLGMGITLSKAARGRMGLRYVKDLGIYALDRGMGSCKWKTRACLQCYNKGLCNAYKNTADAWSPGGKDDQGWARACALAFAGLDRVRLCTRGEPFAKIEDVARVAEWIRDNPNTLFWIPTRAWQTGGNNPQLNWPFIGAIQALIQDLPNARIMASVDRYTMHLWRKIAIQEGFSTMYFDPDNFIPSYAINPGVNLHKCLKTWTKIQNPKTGRMDLHPKGLCADCNACYGAERIDVFLKYHGSAKKSKGLQALDLTM